MSATRNDDAAANSQGASGQFHSSVPRAEPLTTHGHQPGRIAGEKDAAEEFSAQTLPAGSAPPSKTFQPNNTNEVQGTAAFGESGAETANETLGGATSGDVHTGLGHPGSGMSAAEERHDGKSHSKKERSGLEGVGASGV